MDGKGQGPSKKRKNRNKKGNDSVQVKNQDSPSTTVVETTPDDPPTPDMSTTTTTVSSSQSPPEQEDDFSTPLSSPATPSPRKEEEKVKGQESLDSPMVTPEKTETPREKTPQPILSDQNVSLETGEIVVEQQQQVETSSDNKTPEKEIEKIEEEQLPPPSLPKSTAFTDSESRGSVKKEVPQQPPPAVGLVGKPGYFGRFRGVSHSRGDQDSECEDSALQSSRMETSGGGGDPGWMGFTRRQVLTLLVFGMADFFSAIIISLQAPFYPKEAESKGATATEYGLVFGVFELVVFLTSPIFGKYLPKIGPKVIFNVGILTTAVATILFGFLDRFNDRTTFVALSFVVRSIEALGDAAFVTASFAIIANEFPDSVATTFASLETFFGLGLIVGPTVGGALYDKGGFTLPFGVMGGFLFVVAILTILVMPKMAQSVDSDKKHPGGIFDVLKVPGVLLASSCIVTAAVTIGFLNSTLEPHIRQFGLAPVTTGLIFIINGGLYAVSAPLWGWVCDKYSTPKYLIFIGIITIFIGFLLIGPAPFFPMPTYLWLTCVGLVIQGIGLGSSLVGSFIMALREAINHGFPDSIHTYGLTSALWTSSFALGSFIGPSVGGVLLDKFQFRWATVFVLGWLVAMMILIIAFIIKTKGSSSQFTPRSSNYKKRNLSETAPLLSEPPGSSSGKAGLTVEKETYQGATTTTASGYGAMNDQT